MATPSPAGRRTAGRVAVVWFRRDLRLHDHPALSAALEAAHEIVPLFVADPVLLHGEASCARRTDRLWAAVGALRGALAARGSGLIVRAGDPTVVVAEVVRETGATEVHVTADHSPYARRRDAAVAAALGVGGGRLVEHPGLLVHEVGSIATLAGRPYAVFGPFHRRWQATTPRMSLPAPARIASPAWVRHGGKPGVGTGSAGGVAPAGGDLEARGVAATDGIAETDGAAESGGELEALARLEAFLPRLSGYGMDRDRLDRDASSRLSTALHLGTLSPTALVERIAARGGPGADRFLAEVAWRDFYAHRLAAEAGGAEIEPDPITWRDDPVAFEAWATGRTGYPAVDAGMRQLAATGWLPNRARMIAASFLVKDLLIDWRRGARHFMRHLEDGDMASNTGNWRWVAGVGPGSAPWFRIFDPIAQGRRHDPGAHWIRRWLPELADQSDALVHEPWLATPPPSGYPARIVDHAQARRRALAAASARRQG